MPSLNFKGKNAVWNHHLSVPYQILEKDKKLSLKGKNEDENLIIEADNLVALKSLLPKYQGRIKCIYIDPPYNTGNENWVYSDNVSSPLIKEWLKKGPVGSEDLTRHDKWLCMMTPRLKLLRELMSEDGVIFVSINDIESSHVRMLMDDIFNGNFIGMLIWRKKEGGGQTDDYFVTEHEYVLAYAKSPDFKWVDETIPIDEAKFKKEDNDGRFTAVKLAKWGSGARKEDRPTMHFAIKSPDGKNVYPKAPDGSAGRWRVGKLTMDNLLENGLVYWEEKNGDWVAYEKIYYDEEDVKTIKERSILYELASTGDATKALTELFGKKDIFENPKPVELTKFLMRYTTDKSSIILDSFAGSGTTAQAVLELNKEDGKEGNRKVILIQLPEEIRKDKPAYKAGYRYVHEITRERVKRVIERDKLGVGFSYMNLGSQIDADSILSGKLPTYKEFAKYVYYLATGKTGNESIYLIYEKDKDKLKKLAITLEWAEQTNKKDKGKKIIYAPACFIDEEYLEKFNIHFVSIPYNLFEKK
ncbi:MAG: site-specific DNA-methyltransferase [Planctomycetes bacterium]|nr:site-specific DNA-methyltransferase [Planctomycetota bacterium]